MTMQVDRVRWANATAYINVRDHHGEREVAVPTHTLNEVIAETIVDSQVPPDLQELFADVAAGWERPEDRE